jgi:hypothetical protein
MLTELRLFAYDTQKLECDSKSTKASKPTLETWSIFEGWHRFWAGICCRYTEALAWIWDELNLCTLCWSDQETICCSIASRVTYYKPHYSTTSFSRSQWQVLMDPSEYRRAAEARQTGLQTSKAVATYSLLLPHPHLSSVASTLVLSPHSRSETEEEKGWKMEAFSNSRKPVPASVHIPDQVHRTQLGGNSRNV